MLWSCSRLLTLLSASMPSSTCSSLLTLRTLKTLDVTSSCIHKWATSMCSRARFLLCGGCVRRPWHRRPSRSRSHTITILSLLTRALPRPLRARNDVLFACVCVLSACDCRIVSHPHLTSLECPCNLPSLSRNTSPLLHPFLH